MPKAIDIGTAIIECVRPDLVLVRFKPGAVADAQSFLVSMNARMEHFADTPHAVIVVAPDDVDFRTSLLGGDHYKGQGVDNITRMLAVVGSDEALKRILELYFALHPVPFPVKFFTREEEALVWIDAELA